jgi:radical SAM superfamily enzyme YgiQ (UPF0313 family)
MCRRKLLLIQASQYSREDTLCRQERIFLPGLLMPHLAALTPDHWEVETVIEIIEDVPFDTDAELIGIAAMGHAIFRAREIAREFRRRGKTVVFGGYMASLAPSFIADCADSIVFGDAERSWPALLRDVERGELKREYRLAVDDLERLPVPRYELLKDKPTGFMLPVQAGRGCQHRCSFCSIACVYEGRYLSRPVDDVIRDVERIKALGYRGFYLVDDNLVGDRRYLEELTDRLAPLGMFWASQCSLDLARDPALLRRVARAGCRILSFGLESLSQEGLAKLNKAWVKVDDHERLLAEIRRAGIMPTAEFILGTDGDTVESIHRLYDFVLRTKLAIARFFILTPIPGTDLYREFRATDRLLHEDYSRYTSTHCVFRPARMDPDELEAAYQWLIDRVYSLSSIVRRTIWNRNVLRHPLLYLYAFKVNLDYRRLVRRGEAPNVH